MSISLPLPSTALSSHPLRISLSLDHLPAPPGSPSAARHDPFEGLDEGAGGWEADYGDLGAEGVVPEAERGVPEPPTPPHPPTSLSSALSDSASVLFPHVKLAEEAELAEAQDEVAGTEGQLPAWLKETSGRVTALASGRLRSSRTSARDGVGQRGNQANERGGGQGELRVAAGCEDGTIWVFAPPPAEPTTTEGQAVTPRLDGEEARAPRRLSHDSLSHPHSASSSTPSSPPTSPSAGSRHNFSSISPSSPRLTSRRSSTSISTLASTATTRTPRISSSSSFKNPPSFSGQSAAPGTPYEVLRSVSRPRKASATVSISTSSAIPSSSHSPKSDLPDLPALPTSPTPSSPPISPTIPHFVFSGPSPSPSQNPLGSRKEGARTPRSEAAGESGPTSVPLQKRSHSRAKGSIASGIGLWETEGAASSRSSLTSPTEEVGNVIEEITREAEAAIAQAPDQLDELVPVLQIRSTGWGEVVALEVAEGVECADAEEGVVLVVLRSSGHLSVVSLLDGRTFGSCDAVSQLPSSVDSATGLVFTSLQIAIIASSSFAICASSSAVVPVHLGSLVPQEALVGDFGSAAPVVVRCEGATYLIHSSGTSQDLPPLFVTHLAAHETETYGTPLLSLEDPRHVGELSILKGAIKSLRRVGQTYIASDGSSLELFTLRDYRIVPLGALNSSISFRDFYVEPEGRQVVLSYSDSARVYNVTRGSENGLYEFEHIVNLAAGIEHFSFIPSACAPSALFSQADSSGHRTLQLVQLETAPQGGPTKTVSSTQLYRSSARDALRVTSTKALGSDQVLLGYSTGGVALINLAELSSSLPPIRAELVGAITLLDTLELGGRQVVIAGSASGMAAAWNLADFEPLGCWTLFASPVSSFAYIDPSPTSNSKLGNTIAFISANSPVALVSLFPPELLFVLPGTKSGVELIATTKDDIMVLYEQGLARTCDIASRELRRSMDRRTAEKTLGEGGWTVWFRLEKERSSASPSLSAAGTFRPLLHLDLRDFLDEAAQRLPWTESRSAKKRDSPSNGTPTASPDPSSSVPDSLAASDKDDRAVARQLISALVKFGLDASADELLEQLDIVKPSILGSAVVQSDQAISAFNSFSASSPWITSPVATAQRLLVLVSLLRVFLNYPETERSASQAVVYYASCLGDAIGSRFAPPSLEVFARFWLDKNVEVQQAARSLFGTYLAAMPDDQALAFVERWQDSLPACQRGSGVLHHQADHALLVVGLVATERYKLLSSNVLKDLAVSISAYLDDYEHPFHQAVATELCSRGFSIWQNYVDATSLVRQLFAIAIGRNPSTPNDLRLLARNATMHVAGVNTSLFMSTLVNDIVHAPTAAARNATLKLLGFMIRKKPLVLYTSLPRVAEAVVKSLDPTVSTLRETVHQAATVILNELVKTFPSIDFHGKSQRLAVGTHEGAAIVFDLRTATRLYVLEGHTRPVTALSWSPDGHRLVTVSLEESRVAAWKVGVGLLSMFMPGAPPRQGAGSSTTPFKTYDFHVGDEGMMTIAATLEWVVFDWPAERTARLRLRETALNFGV
ncbi:hypothetical protein JCM6882_005860 [Rhodosporidiobolus microsporus]